MTYPKSLREEQLEQLAPVVGPIIGLAPGGMLRLEVEPHLRSRLSYLIYAWLHIQGLKPRFRIRTIASGLLVEHLAPASPTRVEVMEGPAGREEREMSPEEEFVMEHLLDVETPGELEMIFAERGIFGPQAERITSIWEEKVLGLGGEG